jgi:hypothetical protein
LFGWTIGSGFAYKDVTVHSGNPKEGKNNGIEESDQATQEEQEARTH